MVGLASIVGYLQGGSPGTVLLTWTMIVLAYFLVAWFIAGRDPERGVPGAVVEPPMKLSPACLRYVRDLGYDAQCFSTAIISMAHSLGLSVIGEGVENEEQFEFLRSRGAEIVQGYYVSKPMLYDEFKQFVAVSDWIASTAG